VFPCIRYPIEKIQGDFPGTGRENSKKSIKSCNNLLISKIRADGPDRAGLKGMVPFRLEGKHHEPADHRYFHFA
jgi:hypothetical protein